MSDIIQTSDMYDDGSMG